MEIWEVQEKMWKKINWIYFSGFKKKLRTFSFYMKFKELIKDCILFL